VVCTTGQYNNDTGLFNYYLVYTGRKLDLGEVSSNPEPILNPTPIVLPTLTPTEPPLPTPTIQLENPVQSSSPLSLEASNSGLILGVGLAIFIVGGAFMAWIVARRRL